MQGSVRKRGATWSYSFYIGIVDGKKKYKEKGGFTKKGDAQKALTDALCDLNNTGFIEPKKTTFLTVSMDWFDNYVKNIRKISTYNRYKELINKYLSKTIGNMYIAEIECYTVENLLLKIKKENKIGGTTLQAIYTIINTIMNRALKLRLIKDNPCKYVERPPRDNFTPDVLEINEINELYEKLDLDDEYDYMFYVSLRITLELGLRRGELGGIEWEDIDFKQNTINIKNNLIYTNGHVLMSTPKTIESYRQIYISDKLKKLLNDLSIKHKINKLKYGDFYEKNIFDDKEYDLVMKWYSGKYIHPSYYIHKLKKTLKKAGINKNVRFHDLRHTNATLLLGQGVDFKTIQIRLGHKDINTTLNIYSHVNKEMQKNATEKLLKILNN